MLGVDNLSGWVIVMLSGRLLLNMTTELPGLAFPVLSVSLGGAQRVTWSARFAWIVKANGETVRVPRSKLPSVDKWTAFNLADAATLNS